MFINRFFATLVIRPGATGGDKIIQLLKRKVVRGPAQGLTIDESLVELLDDKARDFEKLMARCGPRRRSEEHTSELQSLMRISYAVFCLKKKNNKDKHENK